MAKAKTAKSNGNGTSGKALMWTFGILVLSFVLIVASAFVLPGASQFVRTHPGDFAGRFVPGDAMPADDYMDFRLVLSAANALIAIYLIFIYVKDYLKLRSAFTLGIIAVLFSFLLYALTSVPLVHILFGRYGAGSFSFVPLLFSAIGLLIFAKLSNE
ncbi:Uncharacterised protein [Candidatus Norongarragalina meridionalis]|nr:Uncharacterised protein [Candidatus Norongarragalina meridionalis]